MGQCRKHCTGYCRGHHTRYRRGHRRGHFQGPVSCTSGGKQGAACPSPPPDQGFPICPTAPGWGFSANLPVGCRAAPGSGDVPWSGENGVQGLELTPHVACLNPRLSPSPPPKHCQGNGCKIGKAKSGQHPASTPTLLTPSPSCLGCPHGDRDGDRATLGLRGGPLAARGWGTQSCPPLPAAKTQPPPRAAALLPSC